MYRRSLCSAALTLALLFTVQSVAKAQTAEEIFRQCRERITNIALRSRERIHDIAAAGIPKISELLAAGEISQARELARRAIEQINTTSRNGIERIHAVCRECVAALNALGATELAELLQRHCERAVNSVLEARTRAINAIHALFADAGGG